MKLLLTVCVWCVAAACARAGGGGGGGGDGGGDGGGRDTYTDRWDHLNVDEILESRRLLRGYVDCLLDRGRCTPDARTLKTNLPDVLRGQCARCTRRQREGHDKVVRFLVNSRPDLWAQLAERYDPQRRYHQRFLDIARETTTTPPGALSPH